MTRPRSRGRERRRSRGRSRKRLRQRLRRRKRSGRLLRVAACELMCVKGKSKYERVCMCE